MIVTMKDVKKTIEQSLTNLQTDYVDFLLMHAVDSIETLETILGEDGAIKAAEEAKKRRKNQTYWYIYAWSSRESNCCSKQISF